MHAPSSIDPSRQILNQTASGHERYSRWVFLGTDGWGKKLYPVQNFGRAAINAITLAPKLYLISGSDRCTTSGDKLVSLSSAIEFDEYFNNLLPSKNTRNPWFREYWEETYQCKFAETPITRFNQNYTRECSGLFVLLRARINIHPLLQPSRYR